MTSENIHIKRRGFIALISVMIICAVLLAVCATLSYATFFARGRILGNEYKEKSMMLAHGCISLGLLKLASSANYLGNETVDTEGGSCLIRFVQTLGNERIIESQAVFQNSHTNLRVTIDPLTYAVLSYVEVASF